MRSDDLIAQSLEASWDDLHLRLVALAVSHPWHDQGDAPPCALCAQARGVGKKLDEATAQIKRQMRTGKNVRNMMAADPNANTLTGTLSDIVFHRDGYLIGRLSADGKKVPVKGQCLSPHVGATYTLQGGWASSDKYGATFAFNSYDVALPTSADAVVQYLINTARWIGPAVARAIVDAYGGSALDVLKGSPDRVAADIRGVTLDRAIEIQSTLVDHEAREAVVIGLTGLFSNTGIPSSTIERAVATWGHEALAVVTANPFELTTLRGIGFELADRVRQNLGVRPDDPARVAAGVLYILEEAAIGGGHTYLPDVDFKSRSAKTLFLTFDDVEPTVRAMAASDKVVLEDTEWLGLSGWDVALPQLWGAERAIADKIASMAKQMVGTRAQGDFEHGLAEDQVEALRLARQSSVFVLTGAPGTGKTHLVKRLIECLEADGCERVRLCAPTGKAAKRMIEQTGREATTIHRLLEPAPHHGTMEFSRNAANLLEVDAVIIDECSMIDVPLMGSLMSAVPTGARLLLVGDTNQLPSVGPGNVLRDIITSGAVPVAELRTIKRQGEGNIVRHCHRIRDGMNLGDLVAQNATSTDFFFAQESSPESALAEIVDLVSTRLPAQFEVDPVRDIQVLSPLREKGDLSCKSINNRLQAALNSNLPETGAYFAVGDKVIQLRNDYERGIYNGDIGVVVDSRRTDSSYRVVFDAPTREVSIPWVDNDLELAYAVTIHKSQGSEWPIVVVPVHSSAGKHMLQRNLLYTAISRAKRVCVCVGQQEEIPRIIKRTSQARRNTHLSKLLREAANA